MKRAAPNMGTRGGETQDTERHSLTAMHIFIFIYIEKV